MWLTPWPFRPIRRVLRSPSRLSPCRMMMATKNAKMNKTMAKPGVVFGVFRGNPSGDVAASGKLSAGRKAYEDVAATEDIEKCG